MCLTLIFSSQVWLPSLETKKKNFQPIRGRYSILGTTLTVRMARSAPELSIFFSR